MAENIDLVEITKQINKIKEGLNKLEHTEIDSIAKMSSLSSKIDSYKSVAERLYEKSEELNTTISSLLINGQEYDAQSNILNEDIAKKLKQTIDELHDTKKTIEEDIIKQLDLANMQEQLNISLNKIQESSTKEIVSIDNIKKLEELIQTQLTVLLQKTATLTSITNSLGFDLNVSPKIIEQIVNVIKTTKGKISIDELEFRFGKEAVKQVLETGERLNYWKILF